MSNRIKASEEPLCFHWHSEEVHVKCRSDSAATAMTDHAPVRMLMVHSLRKQYVIVDKPPTASGRHESAPVWFTSAGAGEPQLSLALQRSAGRGHRELGTSVVHACQLSPSPSPRTGSASG